MPNLASDSPSPLRFLPLATLMGGLLAMISGLGLSGCQSEHPLPSQSLQARLDPGLTEIERTHLTRDSARLARLDLSFPKDRDSIFHSVFTGKTPSAAIAQYLGERIHYIFSASTDVETLMKVTSRLNRSSPPPPRLHYTAMASNLGTPNWFYHEKLGPEKSNSFEFEGQRIFFTSSRVGLIKLGPGYSHGEAHTPQLRRLQTFIHEARHSDCTGGLTASDLARIKKMELPESLACGHRHVTCPPDHIYSGIRGCDEHEWGAYMIGAIFTDALQNHCRDCSYAEKQIAKILTLDSLQRINEDSLSTMLYDASSLPDMTSSGVHPPSQPIPEENPS